MELGSVNSDVIRRYLKFESDNYTAELEEAKADYLEFRKDKTAGLVLRERVHWLEEITQLIADIDEMVLDMELR